MMLGGMDTGGEGRGGGKREIGLKLKAGAGEASVEMVFWVRRERNYLW